ncbi:unnamed protein product [Meloidogyne enterolobii]|uniref:Uncharacterized protein n=1 Tax=Meloidogyne enterolobii TaxID=390850 RepID=A0ACB0XX13_MELEN
MFSMKSIYLIIFSLLFLAGNIVCHSGPSNEPPCHVDPNGQECKNCLKHQYPRHC